MESSAKYLKSLVGASGFEPEASCAQGRRATRLRYAPTYLRPYSTEAYEYVHFSDPSHSAKTVPECNRFRKNWTHIVERCSL